MSDPDYPANEGQKVNPSEAENGAGAAPKEPAAATPAEDPPVAEKPEAQEEQVPLDAGAPMAENEEAAKLKDQMMRLAADLENTRRRAEREKREAGQYAIANFARDLISVADNFERALRAAGVSGDDIPEGHSDAFNGLVAGIQMTEKELLTTLQRHGVTKLEPAGEKFDPNLHQAVANVPSAEIAKGCVVDVAQPGFTIGDRVLRAAMVTVSSGAPAAEADGETPASDSTVDEEA